MTTTHPTSEAIDGFASDFSDWLAREMPPGTVISDPRWWAPRIAARFATPQPPQPAGAVPELDAVMRARGLPKVADALGHSRNFALANPTLSQTTRDHIEGLCNMLEIAAAHIAPPPASDYPECSGDPASCPENEGYGCCKPNQPPASVPDGWLPIASAPKHSGRIMLGNEFGAWMADWRPVYQSGFRPDNPWASAMLNLDHIPRDHRYRPATHWRPIPAPPTTPEPRT